MSARSRVVLALAAVSAAVAVNACADKLFRPPVSLSPRIHLQFNTIGAQATVGGKGQILIAAAAYISSVIDTSAQKTDSFRILAGPVVVPVTGASQQVTLNVDLTACLADPTRKGSQTACSLVYGVWLRDSAGFSPDSSDFTKNAYDYTLVGPIDVSPGTAPTLPAITLSTSRFAVFQWQGDEALRLGGPQTPLYFSGPISGSVAGLATGAPPVLFGLTNGFQVTNSCTGQSSSSGNCQNNGFQAAQLAIFRNGTWSRVSAPPGVNQFNDVAAFSPTDVYLAGSSGLFHYDGTSIAAVSGLSGAGSVASVGVVTSGGSKYVIAGTQAGATWIGNTTTWQQYPMPANGASITGVCITGPSEAFAASLNNGGLYRFDGTTWSAVPSSFSQPKGDLQCTGPGQAFVWAQNTALLKWNGSGWTQLPGVGRPVRLAAVSPTEIYAAGDSASSNRNFYRFDGTSWHLIGTTQYQQSLQFRPWADPRGGAAYFASALGRVEMAAGTSVHPVSYSPSIHDAIMTSAGNAFAVGWNLFLARWNGSTWTVDPPPAGTNTLRILNGVWSDGPSNAWAVGSGSTILHWNGSQWSVVGDSLHPAAQPPDNYTAVWGSGGAVWIAGNSSIVRCTGTSACSPDPVTGIDSLFAIWGSSATNAWAVGAHGKILHFNGSQWTPASSPVGRRLVRLWGSSATNVWAVGDTAVLRYDGTSWADLTAAANVGAGAPQQTPLSGAFQLGLWGTGPTEMYVGTWYGSIFRWDGQSFNGMSSAGNQGGGRIVAISGYAGGCAIALLDALESGYTPTLWRGSGPTGCLGSPMPVATPWP